VVKAVSPLLAVLIGLMLATGAVFVHTAAPALADNPLTIPQAPLPTPTVPTVPTTTTTADNSSTGRGLSKNEEVLIFGIGAVLIGLIVFVIRRDARSHAPEGASTERGRQRGTVAPLAKRVERNRAKGKAARRQRKRRR
jgi:hypothetical protein